MNEQQAQTLSSLMRYIDAYAADYAKEGKTATSRQAVERAILYLFTGAVPTLSLHEQQFALVVYKNARCKINDLLPLAGFEHDEVPPWKRLEELKLIECVGSYKWAPLPLLQAFIENSLASLRISEDKPTEVLEFPPITPDKIDHDKCPKCNINPDSMIASCTTKGCPVWRNPT